MSLQQVCLEPFKKIISFKVDSIRKIFKKFIIFDGLLVLEATPTNYTFLESYFHEQYLPCRLYISILNR